MTALAKSTIVTEVEGTKRLAPLGTTEVSYEGALVANKGSNYARALEAGDRFFGLSQVERDNSAGSDGDLKALFKEPVDVERVVTGVTGISDIGKRVYASDDNTLTLTRGTSSCVGIIVGHVTSTTAIVRLRIEPIPHSPSGERLDKCAVATVATAGAVAISAAQVLGMLYHRDCAGGARTDVSPTAAALVAALPGVQIGDARLFIVKNTSDADEALTIGGGTGVTVTGTATIGQNNTKLFLLIFTNVTAGTEAATLYSLGTLVH